MQAQRRGKKQIELPILGWREWVALPALGIIKIKCKIDTGARSSALHAFYVERFRKQRSDWVRFGMHPMQNRKDLERVCEARLQDERVVSDSGGHRERRLVIETPVVIGEHKFEIELTLTDRDSMRFRMLLGRTAMNGKFLVNPVKSYRAGPPHISDADT